MYISKVKMENFKSFEGFYELTFKDGINYIVGNNNTGKTAIFNALDFILHGVAKDEVIFLKQKTSEVSVEA